MNDMISIANQIVIYSVCYCFFFIIYGYALYNIGIWPTARMAASMNLPQESAVNIAAAPSAGIRNPVSQPTAARCIIGAARLPAPALLPAFVRTGSRN